MCFFFGFSVCMSDQKLMMLSSWQLLVLPHNVLIFRVLCGLSCIRFVPDKGFAGADGGRRDDGPVQFEKEDADPFNLENFFDIAKKGKRSHEDSGSSRLVLCLLSQLTGK